ncbi:hypothetical protein N7448_001747 [Penicillium atrosanguineum]|uniref:uncharacterized protein n=1 Tax=Penicillium atrosanguineum TaxID=1132637 RepID=UPI0023917142|nr:uncharacterized protein N7443_005144 [Penicillium atrosanguineum]KAJ5133224.1 hypothetical protein N7526_004589 [Penicillium atrosanguineum]KAJ5150169.1 hypothetical protein N7448_001747 [Penicillium atrosanguineum]KAJ5305484.1 hypothetical protein N7443_005144 [Penicillium atrosanguineum]
MLVLVDVEDSPVVVSILYFQSNVRYDVGGRDLVLLTEVQKCTGVGCVYGSLFFHKQKKMQYQFTQVGRVQQSAVRSPVHGENLVQTERLWCIWLM